MGCCNQRRAAARAVASRPRPVAAPQVRSDAADELVRYIGAASIRVLGPRSRRVYEASTSERLIHADPRDVAALLRTGLFT